MLLRNNSDKVAIDVGGQLSVTDSRGRLVETVEPTTVTILPHGFGLLQEDALDLPKAVRNGSLDLKLSVSELRDPPSEGFESPLKFSDVAYVPGDEESFQECAIRGKVSNTFSKKQSDLQIRVAAFSGGQLAATGFTYIDQVFPRSDATFKVDFVSPSECPDSVDRVTRLSSA